MDLNIEYVELPQCDS